MDGIRQHELGVALSGDARGGLVFGKKMLLALCMKCEYGKDHGMGRFGDGSGPSLLRERKISG